MSHLKQALEIACADELKILPLEEELYELVTVSKKFEKRMRYLLRSGQQVRSKRRVRRTILVAILAAMMTSVMSIQAFREPIADFLLAIYERCTDFIFQSGTVDEEEVRYVIPSAPVGYEEVSREEFQSQVGAEYRSEQGRTIFYTQYRLDGLTLSVDTEGADTDTEDILGRRVFLYSNKGWNSMIWTDGLFAYDLNADCSMQELRGIAEAMMKEIG